ncbi:DUF2480 family protein [Hanamia caeni]|jgi:hypothetical protein|uniref:DUF2480 family protein n=1 Tax=Hanamia caeni TaxID=2294116 RepID=A0A3M9NLM0_9BACT|nr:DUF2480 family protein [Hanamia caeni]RNI38676.1 DUF2480 family protein [Hanamia caeni]
MDDIIINKVAQSVLETLDLENFYPSADLVTFDLKDYLFMELILKEKDYRDTLKNLDWTQYENKIAVITCSADAIIPLWAYMLAVSYLQPFAQDVFFGKKEQVLEDLLLKNISQINPEDFRDKRVVVKGCGDKQIPESAFVEITKKLRPVVKSIMYGEPCSTVPIYKRK